MVFIQNRGFVLGASFWLANSNASIPSSVVQARGGVAVNVIEC